MPKNNKLAELLILSLLTFYPYLLKSQGYSTINYSQNQYAVNTVAPSVASLMKAIDNPVGLYYGNPNISHEIFTLKDGHIVLPITLSYTASGIKVNEEASWVGLGWNLNVGGMIVQSAVGDIDRDQDFTENKDYYPTGEIPAYSIIPYNTNDKSKYDMFFQYGTQDKLQPDVFYFSYPGESGKFCYDYKNDSLYLLSDDKPLIINRYNYSGSPLYGYTNWAITTEDGTRHYYECNMISMENGLSNHVVSRTAKLMTTILPNGQKIQYYYSNKQTHTIHDYSESQNKIFPILRPLILMEQLMHLIILTLI